MMLTRNKLLLLLVAGASISTAASPARAIVLTQDTAPVNFNISGSQTALSPNTTPLNFSAFTASTPSTLVGVQVKFVAPPQFGGSLQLANGGNQTSTFTGTASPSFTFSGIGGSTTGTASLLSLNPPSAAGPSFVTAQVSGSYLGTASALAAATAPLQSYFAGTPSINSYFANWSIVGNPSGGSSDLSAATLNGQIYLSYQYQVPDSVPAPLPVLGAGAAFGFSRKLRKRIRSSAA